MINSSNIENWETVSSFLKNHDIKHYSFDFWNTIAFSNPQFKKNRVELIFNLLNKQVSISAINEAFDKIGKEYNLHQEAGKNVISPVDLLDKVINECNPSNRSINLLNLKCEIDLLFIECSPVIDPCFFEIIDTILSLGKTCSITSNTAFISGHTIKILLNNLGLLNKFSFCLFSDEVGYAKPSNNIFELLYRNAKSNHPQLKVSEIVHLGDNNETDFKGALRFGLKAFQFNLSDNLVNKRNAAHSIVDSQVIPFEPIEYSKFKFGDFSIAKKYGKELFEYFRLIHLPSLIFKYNKILIFSSPYSRIPTSSLYLTQVFLEEFNNFLIENGMKEVKLEFCKISRCQSYTEDYGGMIAEERFNLIKNDTYELLNIPEKEDLCIFIDDISITGTHQRVVEKLLKDNSIETKSLFLYYAKLSNSAICPSFENHLNYSFINDYERLLEIILSETYKITTRATKYILSLKKKDLDYFINELILREKISILNELIYMSYENEFNKIEHYKPNLKIMKFRVDELIKQTEKP